MAQNKLVVKYYRIRSSFYRWKRLLFPSPAELRLIELLGGKVFKIEKLKVNGFAFAIVLRKGRLLRNEKVKREVRVGRYYLDFGNDLYYGLEVDGAAYHKDVVAAFDRDSYIYTRGWRVLHIPALHIYYHPQKVQQQVLGFLLYGKVVR
jgi:very-short-patch-repair endonuclease